MPSRWRRTTFVVAAALVLATAVPSLGQQCPKHGFGSGSQVSGTVTTSSGSSAWTLGAGSLFYFGASDGSWGPLEISPPTWSPVGRGDSVDFVFDLYDAGQEIAELSCQQASFAKITSGKPIPLDTLCSAPPADGGAVSGYPRLLIFTTAPTNRTLVFDLSHASGTALVTSALDARGNGTVKLELDLPGTTLTSVAVYDTDSRRPIASAQPVTAQFSATALTGVATFSDRSDPCPPSGGGCSCFGPGSFWHPGGD